MRFGLVADTSTVQSIWLVDNHRTSKFKVTLTQAGLTTAACTAGYYCTLSSLSTTANPCPAGKYSGAGSIACSTCNCTQGWYCPMSSTTVSGVRCSTGQWSNARGNTTACQLCPVGRYGNVTGAVNSTCSGVCVAGSFGATAGAATPGCNGACTAGYTCPAGSTNSTVGACPIGRYSIAGSTVCSNCSAGYFGTQPALPTASCSGPCSPGRYGADTGMTSPNCSGVCLAGYACPAGSTSLTAVPCLAGTYSDVGQGACTACAAGLYGAASTSTDESCSGQCTAAHGHAVPLLVPCGQAYPDGQLYCGGAGVDDPGSGQ